MMKVSTRQRLAKAGEFASISMMRNTINTQADQTENNNKED